jgi:predicted FMN-binding regulatory protein PaiB
MAKKSDEATLTHNNRTYKVADLPEEAQKQLMNVQAAELEIKRLQMQLALAQTARSAYQLALVEALPRESR